MSHRGCLALLSMLAAGCTLSLDWALPQGPAQDAGQEVDAGLPDLPDAGDDVQDAPPLDLGPDAPDDGGDADLDAVADGASPEDVLDAEDTQAIDIPDTPACSCSDAEVCVDGACVRACPSGQTRCGAVCFDLSQSTSHCGACGITCRQGWRCCAGVCMMRCN
jgi:hypothetical protein